MGPDADDYAWITEGELADGYCVTVAEGATPAEVLARLHAGTPVELTGLHRLARAAEEVPYQRGSRVGMAFVAVTGAGGAAVVVEPNGFLLTEAAVHRPLSAGTGLVTLYYSPHAAPLVQVVADGRVRLRTGPGLLEGDALDAPDVAGALAELGFGPGVTWDARRRALTFALAERLTGVRLAAPAFTGATFLCAAVPDPLHGTPAEGEAEAARRRLARYAARPADAPRTVTDPATRDALAAAEDALRTAFPALKLDP